MNKTLLATVSTFLFFQTLIFAQKIILHLDATPSSTPSVSKAALRYNKDFAYSFTLDDCTVDHYTYAKPFFRGGVVPNTGYTSPGFFFTDGCGNDVVFKAGIAWNSTTTLGYGPNENDAAKVSWAQLQELHSYGWDVLSHSYAHRSWGEITTSNTYATEVIQNVENIRTRLGVETPCFVVPSGDYTYQDIALQQGHKAVFDQNFAPGTTVYYNGITIDGNVNLTNLKAFREDITSQVDNPVKLTNVSNQSTGGTHIWYNEFAHHLDILSGPFNFYKFKDYMVNLANAYGKNGSDRVWFAPLQEVYEYVLSRQNTSYTVALTPDNKCEITLNLAAVPTWMRRKTVTFVINSSVNFSNVTLPQGITATWRGTGATKLLNLDFTNYTPAVPVELTSFSVRTKNDAAYLDWATASERQFQKFEIERSWDGTHYTTIGTVKANGSASKYSFKDLNFQQTSYFRLKMVNNDGSFEYSKIATLYIESIHKVKITPSVYDGNVTVESDFDGKTAATIAVYSQAGELMLQQTATASNTISLDSLPSGIYLVRVTHGLDFWVKKVVKY
jgi:hypothetical protein